MHQEGRRSAKRNKICQGIKLAAKRAVHAAHSRYPPVKQIENTGQQDKTQCQRDLLIKISLVNVRLDYFRQRHKTAKQVSRRKEVWKKIDLELFFRPLIWNWRTRSHSYLIREDSFMPERFYSKTASTVSPPTA